VPVVTRRPLALLLVLFVAAGSAACSKQSEENKPRSPTTTARLGKISLSVLPAAGTPPPVTEAVKATLERYLADAILAPLRSGGPAPDLGPLFTAETAARVGGADRPALVSEGLPRATGGVEGDLTAAAITPLLAGDQVPLVAVSIDLRLRARDVEGATVKVSHQGQLVLVPDVPSWKISGYDITAVRDTPAGTTTTTAVKKTT
jgi:hypothetical protein